ACDRGETAGRRRVRVRRPAVRHGARGKWSGSRRTPVVLTESGEHVIIDGANGSEGKWAGDEIGGQRLHVICGDEGEPAQALVEVVEFTAGDFGPAVPRYLGVRVLERESGCLGERSVR